MRLARLRYFQYRGGPAREPKTYLIRLVSTLPESKSVEIFGTHYQTRDTTAIRDVSDLAGGDMIAVSLASGQGAPIREIINAARVVTGLKSCDVARRCGDPSILAADARHAHGLIGWFTGRSELATIITDAWHRHRKRFEGRNTAGLAVQLANG